MLPDSGPFCYAARAMEALSATDIIALRQELAVALGRADEAEADAANARAINSDLEARIALQALQIEVLKRDRFGQRSERSRRLIDQLELALEAAEATASEDEAAAVAAAKTTTVAAFVRARPSRQPLPAHLPRTRVVIPSPACCAGCGSDRLAQPGEAGGHADPADRRRGNRGGKRHSRAPNVGRQKRSKLKTIVSNGPTSITFGRCTKEHHVC